jgi:hypothetical protein
VKTGKVVRKTKTKLADDAGKPRKYPFAVLPGGKAEVVLYPDWLVVQDTATGKELLSRPAQLDGPGSAVVLSADGKRAATCHPLGTILVWDLSGAGQE